MKKILSGNEAVARGAYEAGLSLASAYPGTPSTEILETIAKEYHDIHSEWTPNEKVALEVAVGASYAGARSLAVMKHVGVNVAADPLMTLPYTLIRGGIVLISADDPELFSSQNEQDNRHYARFAKIAMLEPASSQEAKDFTRDAFKISEDFGTPVMVRTTTRISHSMGVVELYEPEAKKTPSLERHPAEWVMLPANARRRHPVIEERVLALKKLSNTTSMNRMEMADTKLGIISSGVAYQYAKEAFPNASFLKVGMPYPFPDELVKEFAAKVKELWVVEELDPFMEEQVKALGINCHGKDRIPLCGELNPDIIKAAISGAAVMKHDQRALPGRPPNMCPGCPHRSMLWALRRNKTFIAGDIGCYTLGFLPPLDAIDTCLCMGAGINHAHGMSKVFGAGKEKLTAVIGDSTFYHSGIKALAERNAQAYGLTERARYHLGSCDRLPFEKDTFDAVFTNGSLHEWANPCGAFDEIWRVLKPGGQYFISDLRRDMNRLMRGFLWVSVRPTAMRPGLVTSLDAAYTPEELQAMLARTCLKEGTVEGNIIGMELFGVKASDRPVIP